MNILFEDNHLLVVEKPHNIPVQADSSGDEDLLSLLKAYIKEKYQKPGDVYLGLVHRLDRPVGGVMVFARTSKAAARLSMDMKQGKFEKIYYAVVSGVPAKPKARLTHYLLKDMSKNQVHVVAQAVEGAKEAVLEYETLATSGNYSLLKVKLFTGRAHQIRVQLSHIGHPIFGDRKYGGVSPAGCKMALFAVRLSFPHPVKKEQMTFLCYPPKSDPWNRFDFRLE